MKIEIVNIPFSIDIYGFSGKAINKDYSDTAFRLSGKMWQAVKSNNLKNNGINVWVYEPDEMVFAGVELDGTPDQDFGLEQKTITLMKYAYFKHIGPYNRIRLAGQAMTDEIKQRGFKSGLPYIEIYGHWTNDESKLETELLMTLK
jgi:effector-binding domain-containing protein